MHIRRISVAKYPYPYSFKQGNYYPYPIRIRENCGYPQNIRGSAHSCSLPNDNSRCTFRIIFQKTCARV